MQLSTASNPDILEWNKMYKKNSYKSHEYISSYMN